MMKTNHETGTSRVRLILIALILPFGRLLGRRALRPSPVQRSGSPPHRRRPASAQFEERLRAFRISHRRRILNVRIYRQASPAVANVLTKATEYDFFMDPVPVEGAGSGFLIDPRGYILTNFHVVAGAQTIEVNPWRQEPLSREIHRRPTSAMMSALIKIEPKGKHLASLTLGDSSALQVGQKSSGRSAIRSVFSLRSPRV